jgi:methylenetetrahydrofolate dehydrogenase (NADP+) / methenyltetrahydrofolate cyclohydrolase
MSASAPISRASPRFDQLDAGDEGRGDGAETDREDARAGRRPAQRVEFVTTRRSCVGRRPRTMPAVTNAAIVMDGAALRDEIVAALRAEIESAGSPSVCLATVLVGDDLPSERYVRSKQRFADEAAMLSRHVGLPATASQDEVEAAVDELGADPDVHGILVQLPLPTELDADPVIARVPVDKDVDGLTDRSLGRLVRGEPGLLPCTPLGVMRLLERYDVPVAGRRAVVVGRSTLVGLPAALLLARKGTDATVTMAHSKTRDLAAVCREADILIAAAGQARIITVDHVKAGAAVIDVGVSRTEGGLVGDVDFDAVRDVAGWITPMPGGTGPMTVACLLQNTLTAARLQGAFPFAAV